MDIIDNILTAEDPLRYCSHCDARGTIYVGNDRHIVEKKIRYKSWRDKRDIVRLWHKTGKIPCGWCGGTGYLGGRL